MTTRRNLLLGVTLVAAAPKKTAHKEEDVSPGEDLMREHGLLNRVLLIYEECVRQKNTRTIGAAAAIIRDFIEGYHEKLEEEFLFPRLEKADKLADLTATLRKQHARGRDITAQLIAGGGDVPQLVAKFIRMYRPHEAREDTILFPAFHELVGDKEYERLGDKFEDREHQLFGEKGFEGKVDEVAQIERQLGIYDLAQFTP
ncbi:MAG: hemerythrin domain-containing protein [Myxococcales bacterium]|nr:hemerythrin domain-containing protein [Myxococcales bacterium]